MSTEPRMKRALGIIALIVLAILGSRNVSHSPPAPAVSDKELIAHAHKFNFAEAARNPQQCNGTLVSGDGKVIQVAEGWGNSVTLRLDVTQTSKSYGISWGDTVLMRYRRRSDTESRILENDLIQFWGQCQGDETYTTVLGAIELAGYV